MSIKSRFANWAMKASSFTSNYGYIWGGSSASWSEANDTSFINHGYKANVIAYRCITLIARASARVPLAVYEGSPENQGEKLDGHPILDLLNNPNPFSDKTTLIEGFLSFQMITGDAFLEGIAVDNDSRIAELWILPSQNMSVNADNSPTPISYTLSVGGSKLVFPIDEDGKSTIMHSHYFNPSSPWEGLSPMEPALKSIEQHNSTGEFNKSLLDNQAQPSGALMYSPKDGKDKLTNDQFNRIKEQMTKNMEGARNAGKPLLLDGGMEWIQMGLSPVSDLGMLDNKKMSATEIALAYAVPGQFVGITDAMTYNNVAEAKLDLYEQAVLPALGSFCREITKFFKRFTEDQNWFLWYDEDKIEALEPRRTMLFDRAAKGFTSGMLTTNESRAMIGKEAIEGGDDIYISSGMLPLSFEIDLGEGGDG